MISDGDFSRLRSLAAGGGEADASWPPEVYEAWRGGGAAFGRFVLVGELGRGGSSVVYRAWQTDLTRFVALKVVPGLNPELRERFLQEARLGGRLSHPTILPILDAGESDGSLWLAMPLVDGPTLDGCALDFREAALAVAAAARGVHAAHEAGVLHRDLKPRNIMKDASGVHLMDFGLAKTGDGPTAISATGQILGTPQYMAPEQAAGLPVDRRTDVYGLGATLYRLVTGRPPYAATAFAEFLRDIASSDPVPPVSVAPGIPASLGIVIMKAMERDPARRYPTAEALADDLEAFARGEPVVARRTSAPVRWMRSLKRHRLKTIAAISLVLIPAATLVGAKLEHENRPEPARFSALQLQVEKITGEAGQFAAQGRNLEAIEAYTRVLALDPGNLAARVQRAICHMTLSQWTEAIPDLEQVAARDPDRRGVLRMRGNCRKQTGELPGALSDLSRAIALEPDRADYLLERAEVHAAMKNWEAALSDDNAAIEKNPRNAWAYSSRAVLYFKFERFAEAVEDYGRAIQNGGRQAKFLLGRARAKLKLGDGTGALEDLNEVTDLDPVLGGECEDDFVWARQLIADAKK